MAKTEDTTADSGIELRFLGALEVVRDGERIALPRSKKTRALLAYLAMTGREQNRQRLCSLLWDVTDDPRGALRWSLSKLRGVLNDPDAERIAADRHVVRFVPHGAKIDALALAVAVRGGVADRSLGELEALAADARGEFLEGFELPDFLEFQAWCMGLRESTRAARCQVLGELVRRQLDHPAKALPFAQSRVQADPLSVAARADALQLLLRAGMREQAKQQLEAGCRLLREVGAPGASELEQAYRDFASAPRGAAPAAAEQAAAPPAVAQRPREPVQQEPVPSADAVPFVGRASEQARLGELLDQVRTRGSQRMALVVGEPGAGKSRLAEQVVAQARAAGVPVLAGRAYESEGSRPYGPWVDALGKDLTQLLPEAAEAGSVLGRDSLFAAVAEASAATAAEQGAAVLFFDDLQWVDRDSAELLHFVARSTQQQPLLILLSARSGELADNEAALRALRGLRRETRVEEIELEPLSQADLEQLAQGHPGVDGERLRAVSAGNPLYALELLRAADSGLADTPASLLELVRERTERLPSQAADVLRWAAVLGSSVDVSRLSSLSSLEPGELVTALESLEQHALLRSDDGRGAGRYAFAHDVVREAVYGELSQPRRRLMHQQIARLLEAQISDPAVANEVAHHASLAGDALLGVKACIAAGQRSLRIFANGDAESLARRGLSLAAELEESDRVSFTLELLHVQYAARAPDLQEAAARVGPLAERALDLGLTRAARLGFQMLSYLRWESSSMVDAHEHIMLAERISRSADPGERSVALAQAARCLVLLERDLGQAEAFAMEAESLTERTGRPTSAVTFASGMLHEHRGELDDARRAFREARELGREGGDRLAEFRALQHWLMLELDEGDLEQARSLADRLEDLGGRLREGSEAPTGRALKALVALLSGEGETQEALDAAIRELEVADAKYELSYVLTRLAGIELAAGRHDTARDHATRALELAVALRRPSSVALARARLAQCAQRTGDTALFDEQAEALAALPEADLSAAAQSARAQILA